MTRPPFFIYQTFLPSRRRDCLTTIPRLHQPFQNRTIPLAFRRVSVCVCLVGFASLQSLWAFISGILALLAPSRCIDPLHFYNLFKSTSIASPRTITLASLVKGRWIDGKAQALILLRSVCDTSTFFYLSNFSAVKTEGLPHHHPSLAPTLPKPHYPSRFS